MTSDLEPSGNSFMWLNGNDIGRHWEIGPQREYYLPECWLNFGEGRKNVLMLGLRQTVNGEELRAAEVFSLSRALRRPEADPTPSRRNRKPEVIKPPGTFHDHDGLDPAAKGADITELRRPRAKDKPVFPGGGKDFSACGVDAGGSFEN